METQGARAARWAAKARPRRSKARLSTEPATPAAPGVRPSIRGTTTQDKDGFRVIKMTKENWKRFFLQMFKRETLVVPNEDGTGFYDLGVRSSELSVSEMSDCMELISAFGSERGVKFRDTSDKPTHSRAA